MLATGRMPLANSEEQSHRKRPAYSDGDITALVAYVASLGQGPKLPAVDLDQAQLPGGGEIFRGNCAPCHAAAGIGGALSYGRAAPGLHEATPLEVAAAVRAGPGQMPVFDEDAIPDDQLDDLIAYVEYLKRPEDPGGLAIGRVGPVPEGFIAWFFGIGAFLAAAAWIGTRSPARPPAVARAGDDADEPPVESAVVAVPSGAAAAAEATGSRSSGALIDAPAGEAAPGGEGASADEPRAGPERGAK
jgi:hypothetical protein